MNDTDCGLSTDDRIKFLEEDYVKIKCNLKNIIESEKFCGICLANTSQYYFYMLDFTAITDDDSVSLEQMLCEVFSDQMAGEMLSKCICNICIEEVKKGYRFLCKVKNYSLIVNQLLEQINEQVEEVSSLAVDPEDNISNFIIGIQGFDPETIKTNQHKEEIIEKSVETQLLICDYCARSFKAKWTLKKHISEKHLKQNCLSMNCTECLNMPCVHEKYLASMRAQKLAGYKELQCLECDIRLANVADMIAHANREHLNIFPYLCETCGRAFPSKKSHNTHTKQFHTVEKRICQYCDRRFTNKEVLYIHKEQCQIVTRKYMCDLCPASFNSQQSLQIHHSKHLNKFQCAMCSKSFYTHFTLLRHRRRVHELVTKPPKRQRPADRMCSICPAKFPNLTQLKEHLGMHGPNEKHKCEVCDKQFESRKAYTGHIRSYPHQIRLNPNRNFSFPCADCDKSFPSTKMLENHRNLIHLKIKPYVCQTCNKAFTTGTHLKHHLQIHEGIKKYQCSQCSIMLTTLSSLKKHVLRYHSDKKPYSCNMCDKTFVCRSEMLQHTLKNHSDMTISCPICGGNFRHRSNLKSHIYKVHMRDKDLQKLLEEHKHNTELIELMHDRRNQRIDNSQF